MLSQRMLATPHFQALRSMLARSTAHCPGLAVGVCAHVGGGAQGTKRSHAHGGPGPGKGSQEPAPKARRGAARGRREAVQRARPSPARPLPSSPALGEPSSSERTSQPATDASWGGIDATLARTHLKLMYMYVSTLRMKLQPEILLFPGRGFWGKKHNAIPRYHGISIEGLPSTTSI